MKKILYILFMTFSLAGFSQSYSYKVKFKDIIDQDAAKPVYDEYVKYTPENGLTIRLADPYIREEKLNSLGIWG